MGAAMSKESRIAENAKFTGGQATHGLIQLRKAPPLPKPEPSARNPEPWFLNPKLSCSEPCGASLLGVPNLEE